MVNKCLLYSTVLGFLNLFFTHTDIMYESCWNPLNQTIVKEVFFRNSIENSEDEQKTFGKSSNHKLC